MWTKKERNAQATKIRPIRTIVNMSCKEIECFKSMTESLWLYPYGDPYDKP